MKEVQIPLSKKRTLIPILLLSAALLSLSFDPFNFSFLAYICIAPLYALTYRRFNKSTFWLGTAWGLSHFYFSFIWLSAVKPLAYLNPLMMALIWTTLPGFWIYFLRKLQRYLILKDPKQAIMDKETKDFIPDNKQAIILLVAGSFLWLFLEWLRFWLFTGFPWNTLGNSQAYIKPLVSLASSLGVLGVSFPVILTNLFIGLLLERLILSRKSNLKLKFPKLLSLAFLILFVTPFIFNHIVKVENKVDHKLKVGLVQGHFIPDLFKRLSYEEIAFQIKTYNELSRELIKENKIDFLLWPETAIAVSYTNFRPYQDTVNKLSQDIKIPFMIGTSFHQREKNEVESYNSALMFKNGQITNAYAKIHIVPYGEYTPLKGYMPDSWHKKINEFSGMGPGLTRGKNYTIFDINEKVRFGVNICFEDVFPDHSIIYARRYANLLVTLTNDAWFLETAGGAQHTAHSIFRAVETGLPLLRSGNHSESSVILPDGTIKELLVNPENGSRFYRGSAVYELPITLNPQQTFYVRYPDFFIIIIGFITALTFLVLLVSYFQKKLLFKQLVSDLKEK